MILAAEQVVRYSIPSCSTNIIKRSALTEIAEQKMKDLNANDIEQATKIIEGSARSMGLDVVEG